jgi:hypothetical protein
MYFDTKSYLKSNLTIQTFNLARKPLWSFVVTDLWTLGRSHRNLRGCLPTYTYLMRMASRGVLINNSGLASRKNISRLFIRRARHLNGQPTWWQHLTARHVSRRWHFLKPDQWSKKFPSFVIDSGKLKV